MAREGDIYFNEATVESVALSKTSAGKPQLCITFDTGDEPRHVTAYRFFTDASLPYTEKDLRALGWDPVENAWRIDDLVELEPIRGNKADLTCAWEEYEKSDGTVSKSLKVKFINPVGGGGAVRDRMDANEAKTFAAQLRQKLGVTGGAARRPATVPASQVAVGPDDDIPF
jgi:hypothetical protein